MYADGKLRNHTFFVPRKCAKRHLGGALPTRPSQDPPPYGKRGAAAPPLILPGGVLNLQSRAKVDMCALPTLDKYKSRFGVMPKAGLRAS